MAKLSLRHMYKVYPNGVKAVNDFNMEINDDEFIVFVGPSGCGKSTTLRMIAGLEEISAGELYIDDELVNNVEPKDRDISMVFQNYALYPHMSVYDNMAFGLRLRHVPQEEIHKKVLWAANALKITEYLNRKPKALSGGQRQRVALGRAILRNPKVFLLDEPLSNLDAKLRTEMRAEIAKLHNQLKTTFIYVTHDQVEAMTLGSRVVVMKLGYIQQIDTPINLYNYPENKFVAGFIGTPQMSFFDVTLNRKKDDVAIKFAKTGDEIHAKLDDVIRVDQSYFYKEKPVILGIRCEDVSIDPEVVKKSDAKIKIKISHFEELGNETLVYGDVNVNNKDFSDNSTSIIVKNYKTGLGLKPGDVVEAAINVKKAHFFDAKTEKTICSRIPTTNTFDCSIKNRTLEVLGSKIKLPDAFEIDNLENGEIYVPVEAIGFDGDIEAKVTRVEEVGEHKVFTLNIGERSFFVVDANLKLNQKVKISINLEKITIAKDGEILVKPLHSYSKVVGSFTNLENNKLACKSIVKYKNACVEEQVKNINFDRRKAIADITNCKMVCDVKDEYKNHVNDINMKITDILSNCDIAKEEKKKMVAEKKRELAKAKGEYKTDLAAIKENSKKELSSEQTAKISSTNKEFDTKVAVKNECAHSFAEATSVGASKIKKIALEDIKAAETLLCKDVEKLNKELEAEIAKVKSTKEFVNADENQKDKLIEAVRNSFAAKKDELISASKVFYFVINGVYVKSNYEISKKIIQALGSSVFNSNYRFEISIDSLHIAKEGFKAKVAKIIDYGNGKKYIVAEAFGDKFTLRAEKGIKENDTIKVTFDLEDLRIYENKFDIRLY